MSPQEDAQPQEQPRKFADDVVLDELRRAQYLLQEQWLLEREPPGSVNAARQVGVGQHRMLTALTAVVDALVTERSEWLIARDAIYNPARELADAVPLAVSQALADQIDGAVYASDGGVKEPIELAGIVDHHVFEGEGYPWYTEERRCAHQMPWGYPCRRVAGDHKRVCTGVLNIAGEHFDCDNPAPHLGWAHTNQAAQAIWADAGVKLTVPEVPSHIDYHTQDLDRQKQFLAREKERMEQWQSSHP